MRLNLKVAGALVIAVALAACSASGSGGTSSSGPASGGGSATGTPSASGSASPSIQGSGSGIKLASTGIGQVLANSGGLTIYWFSLDTAAASKCDGSCASYWPPVKGPVSAASGVSLPGKFGTIKRSDGTVQATYDGHPLYTYSGDPGPGQTTGNGLNLSGGLWYAMTPSGAKPASSSPSPSQSSSGGGPYGY